MQQLILNHYKGAHQRVFIFSPTVHTDISSWGPIKKHLENDLHIDLKKEPAFFDTFDAKALREIIETQKKVAMRQKERYQSGDRSQRRLFSILIVIDDFGDDESVMRYSANAQLIKHLYVAGRHHGISTWLSIQKLRFAQNAVRVNATGLLTFRTRNQKEYEALAEEASALVDKETFRRVYDAATKEPFSFLFMKLNARELNDIFYVRFEKRITFPDDDLSPPPEPHDDSSSSAQSTRGRALGR